jgi:HTH-type transcriptional regulator/antitoxin HigA
MASTRVSALMDIAAIKTPRQYRRALKEIERLMSAKRNTADGTRLDALVTLVEMWEAKHHTLDLGHATEGAGFRIRRMG